VKVDVYLDDQYQGEATFVCVPRIGEYVVWRGECYRVVVVRHESDELLNGVVKVFLL